VAIRAREAVRALVDVTACRETRFGVAALLYTAPGAEKEAPAAVTAALAGRFGAGQRAIGEGVASAEIVAAMQAVAGGAVLRGFGVLTAGASAASLHDVPAFLAAAPGEMLVLDPKDGILLQTEPPQ
jgi:hypothetical protein